MTTLPTRTRDNPTRAELLWLVSRARSPRLRSMAEFAEQEVVLPDGPFKGRRFRCDRQPYTRLWFDAVDSGRWSRHFATGPVQSGKTLSCYITPLLHSLFELQETTICGLPSMEMAGDKWKIDILPAIESSPFRELLPTSGAGSRGGTIESITFRNGVTLRFMSGGGGDKKRAGFTARVLVVTETDGLDEAGEVSREADPLKQLEARTRAFGARKRCFFECTVSTEEGRTWQEYTHGTESRIAVPCPHCRQWVTPEREHLVGWREAESLVEARSAATFVCPDCSAVLTAEQRVAMNQQGRLLHRGQSINAKGQVVGDPPQTDTLGFRWNAFNNLFVTPADIAADEWKAARSVDEDNAERELRQFIWALPHVPDASADTPLEVDAICRRVRPGVRRGFAPEGAECVTVGIDVGKFELHYVAPSWLPGGGGHILDYGVRDVASNDLGTERAILQALRKLRDEVLAPGWDDGKLVPAEVWVDSGYESEAVYAFCRESGERYRPTKGHGAGAHRGGIYAKPAKTNSEVRLIGEGYHFVKLRPQKIQLVHVDADHWKTRAHQRLGCPVGEAGAVTLFDTGPMDHLKFARHVTSEQKVEEFEPGRGVVTKWVQSRRANHFFDAYALGAAAGHHAGARVIPPASPGPAAARSSAGGWFAQQRRRDA